ncbi:polyadenylate-binding protein RBP47 isoform X1 [Lactuca sativa]|uniref:polyadenylate-binding protein RBP47 isoform X1 n=1 Tax=Lactuca sativa TaxID=4236 RepID=UPI000CD963DA|nr:polyadenylate-binding protein RBP47 isoform X1 [Lactuca sativa]
MQPTNGSGGGDLTQQQQQQQQQWLAMQQFQQQQWLAMQQYPAAAASMGMHHPAMMYQQPPPHYMPYHYQQQQYQQQQSQQSQKGNQIQTSSEDNKTIWVGDLQHWMDEAYLQSCFAQTGEVSSIKLIRNKQTGQSERYGFIEFLSHEAADKVLQSYNGTMMPTTDQAFRLNWASFSTGEKRAEIGSDLSIFIGDLAPDVTDTILYETFAGRYPSVKGAKVVVDTNTGCSKGYGFVRFSDENEKTRAMNEMNGQYCSSRPMRIGVATPKKAPIQQQYGQQQYSSQAVLLAGGNGGFGAIPQNSQSDGDSSNTTIFVGGLDSEVTDEDLRQTFSQCGEILSIKIPLGKGCGFVQFASRSSAEDAIQNMHGTVIGKQTVRISWGKTPANRQRMGGSNGNYYQKQGGYGGGGYGYGGQQTQDSGMYGGADASTYESNGYNHHQQPVS